MRVRTATLTSKGQVTIPADVRKHLNLAKSDRLAFVIEDDGSVHLRVPRYPTVASLQGAAGSLGTRRPWREVRDVAREDYLEQDFPVGS